MASTTSSDKRILKSFVAYFKLKNTLSTLPELHLTVNSSGEPGRVFIKNSKKISSPEVSRRRGFQNTGGSQQLTSKNLPKSSA